MKTNIYISLCTLWALSACGYKGDLYLPKENDKNQFGVIQTGASLPHPFLKPAPEQHLNKTEE